MAKAPAPTNKALPHRRVEPVELSGYRAAIQSLNEFASAMNAVPVARRDPELVRLLAEWQSSRDAVMERFQRVKNRI